MLCLWPDQALPSSLSSGPWTYLSTVSLEQKPSPWLSLAQPPASRSPMRHRQCYACGRTNVIQVRQVPKSSSLPYTFTITILR